MNIFSEVINGDNLLEASGVISICVLVYYFSQWMYDFITKTDIEKCLTYRGKDRIILGVSAFILNAILVVMTTFEQLIESKDESDLVYYIILSIVLTVICQIFTIVIFVVAHFLLTLLKAYPEYEVKLYEDKKGYWKIRKVTRENRVILNKNGHYITLSNVKELDNKIIREKSKKKK